MLSLCAMKYKELSTSPRELCQMGLIPLDPVQLTPLCSHGGWKGACSGQIRLLSAW